MNFRAKILRMAKANGYTGADADTDALIKWLAENGINVADPATGKAMDEKAIKAALTPKTMVLDDDDAGDTDPASERVKQLEKENEQLKSRKGVADARGGTNKVTQTEAVKALADAGDHPDHTNKWFAQKDAADGTLIKRSPQDWVRMAERKSYNQRAKNGRGSHMGGTSFSDYDTAEIFGSWFRKAITRGKSYGLKKWDEDVLSKTAVTYDDSLGGALIPDFFLPDIIDLREQYGEVAPLCKNVDIPSDVMRVPRRTGGLTAYRVGEGAAGTASTKTWDTVTATASKDMVLTYVTPEMLNDAQASGVNVMDDIFGEIVYAFEKDLDNAILNGDGTLSYTNSAVGISLRFRQVVEAAGGTWATNADYGAGIVVGTGNLWSELVDQDYSNMVGRLPKYASSDPASRWLTSHTHWGTRIEPLIRAAGGATTESYQNRLTKMFKGFAVETSQLMPLVDANSSFVAYLGNFSKAVMIGRVRNSMRIATSEHFDFDNDVIAVRGTHRVAIAVHDVGNASSTASSRVPGPIVGLLTAAS